MTWLGDQGCCPQRHEGQLRALSLGRAGAGASRRRPCSGGRGGSRVILGKCGAHGVAKARRR